MLKYKKRKYKMVKNETIKIKHIVLTVISVIALIILVRIVYIGFYTASYKELELEEIDRCTDEGIYTETPYWTSVYKDKNVNALKDKYGVSIDVDLNKNMLIVSYGAELTGLDYNTLEPAYRSRGSYVGFPTFNNIQNNTVYFYKTKRVPLLNTEVAGYPPEYNGQYRK